ncbi:MAG: hypothetical protein WCR56_01820 [Bacilli bacterium]|jgi:hypothetical protein
MEDKNYNVQEALKLLKAGYSLIEQAKSQDTYFVFNGKDIVVRNETEGLIINPFSFLDLYKDSLFQIDYSQSDEEAVDPKKDDEYYSWRQ